MFGDSSKEKFYLEEEKLFTLTFKSYFYFAIVHYTFNHLRSLWISL
jgi:hypothetical protein